MPIERTLSAFAMSLLLAALWPSPAAVNAQLVQPVIAEYKTKASGRIMLTNNSAEAMAVVLEPRSFSISPEGHGSFRALDPGIDVELSAMSVTLQPQQSYYIFYKATAQTFPAWFTIYATFSQLHHGRALDVRIQLPHTVYIYQKKPLERSEIEVSKAVYSEDQHQITVELKNTGPSLGRVLVVRANGPKSDPAVASGFPMLPGLTRQVKLEWKEKSPPSGVQIEFEHFSLTPPVVIAPRAVAGLQSSISGRTVPAVPSASPGSKVPETPQR